MKKKLFALCLALAVGLALFAGCGGSSNNAGSGTDGDADADTGDAASAPADDTVYEFNVINHDAATSMGQLYVETLFGQIEEESGGRLKFNYFPGGSLFAGTEAIDAVKEGSADIAWSTSAFFGGVFPISEFINLPVNGINSASMATAVLQDMIAEIPDCASEYDDWHVLANHASSRSPISTIKKKIEKPSDFKGLQIRAAGTIPSMYINAIGATAIAMPTTDVYEALSKGVIDGMANDFHNIDCFKLYEAVDYCLNFPVNVAACFVLMNQDRYNALPDDLKAIFDKYSESGYAADMAGYWWDSCNFWVADEMRENGVEVYEPTPELYEYMYSDEIVNSVHQSYIDYLNGMGIDGQAMYDKCMEIVARYTDEYAGLFDTEFHYSDWDLNSVNGYNGYQG
jgi:TRAP-type C4-dicarboxylate transport system substrate-binding protein